MLIGSALSGLAAAPVRAADGPVLLVLGDSLSAAYGMALDQGWVALLQRRIEERGLAWRVVNASISGDTTAGGLARLPALLAEHRPALVILELGANDGLRGLPPERIADNLRRLIAMAREAGAGVLLVAVPMPPNYGQAYTLRFQRLFPEVAGDSGVALVPGLLDGIAVDVNQMQEDGLHPLPAAQPRMLEHVWGVLAPLLGDSAP